MGPFEAFKLYRLMNKLQSAWENSFWRTSQMGWKTILGALIVAGSAGLRFMEAQGLCQGCAEIAGAVEAIGIAIGVVGLRHAIAKSAAPVIVLACLLGLGTAQAQNRSVWVGASLDATAEPNAAGHVCGLLGTTGSQTFSLTCLSARNGGEDKPIYDVEQGIAQHLFDWGGLIHVYGLATGGISTTDTGSNGLFGGGFAATFKIKEGLEIVGAAKGAWSPALEDRAAPRFAIGFRYEPK